MVEDYDDDDKFAITDWIAPWIDGGERVRSYIESIKETAEGDHDGDHDIVWQIGMLLLCRQLEDDILMAGLAREMGLNSDPTSN